MANPRSAESDHVTDYTLHAGRVKRYHTWAVHHNQTIGEHCWQIARIFETIFGPPDAEVERFIRHHDTPELIVGDPPFPVKANNPPLKSIYDYMEADAYSDLGITLPYLDATDKTRVKVCDLIEMMEFGMVELEMGNRLAIPIITRTRDAALKISDRLSEGDQYSVEQYITQQMTRHSAVMSQTI